MVFLLILPSALVGLVALSVTGVLIHVEIAERRRTRRHFRHRVFRPVVIAGGKGQPVRSGPELAAAEVEPAEIIPVKLVRAAPP